MKRVMKIISVSFTFFIFVNLNLWSQEGSLKQKVSLKGEPLISSFLKKEIATVVFSAPQGGLLYTYRGLISGFNHDLTGKKLKGNEITAIKYSQKGRVITRGTRLEGKGKLEKVASLSLKKDVIDLLKKNADIVIDKDTTYGEKEEENIGDLDDPKIVVVKNARLTLRKNFKGYGVLIFTGNKGPFYRLYMYDNATWYGLVISDCNKAGFRLRGKIIPIYGKKGSYINQCKIYKIRMLRYKTLYERYKKLYEEYCQKPSPLHKKRNLTSWRCSLYEKYLSIYKRLYEKYKKLYEKCSKKPEVSNPAILGAVLLEGRKAYLYLYGARILYCQEVVEEKICKKLIEERIATSEVLPLKLEEYKEEE